MRRISTPAFNTWRPTTFVRLSMPANVLAAPMLTRSLLRVVRPETENEYNALVWFTLVEYAVLRLKPNLTSLTNVGEKTSSSPIAALTGEEFNTWVSRRYWPELAKGALLCARSIFTRANTVVVSEKR